MEDVPQHACEPLEVYNLNVGLHLGSECFIV